MSLLRLAKDGTPLDDEPIRLTTLGPRAGLSCVFDGQDDVIGWWEIGSVARSVRLAPLGAPDVREHQGV